MKTQQLKPGVLGGWWGEPGTDPEPETSSNPCLDFSLAVSMGAGEEAILPFLCTALPITANPSSLCAPGTRQSRESSMRQGPALDLVHRCCSRTTKAICSLF